MAHPPERRQQVHDFRARLDTMLARQVAAPRHHIDQRGGRSRDLGFKTNEARLIHYARRRYNSVARVLALLAIARELEHLDTRVPPVTVSVRGAYWQAFGGTDDHNACHTCPCLLMFDGQWPTRITGNRGLQRHLLVEFADCMLMPKSINGIDKLVDDKLGASAFELAATHVLHTAGATWRDGLGVFDAEMADVYVNAHAILFGPATQAQPRRADEEHALDVLCAYYEGLHASRRDSAAIENFRRDVIREMAIPPTPSPPTGRGG